MQKKSKETSRYIFLISIMNVPRLTQLILFGLLISNFAHAGTEPLRTGENLPVIQGETLAGKSLELPAASAEKITLIVFSFTKKGGSFARQWAERFEKEFASTSSVKCYSVMFFEGVPRLLRSFVSSGIKKGIPKDKHPYLLRVYKNEKLWKERLEVSKEDNPYLALLDRSGKIIWLNTGQFSEEHFSELADKTKRNLKEKSQP